MFQLRPKKALGKKNIREKKKVKAPTLNHKEYAQKNAINDTHFSFAQSANRANAALPLLFFPTIPPFSPPFPLPTPSSDPLPAPKFPHSFFRSPRSAHNPALLLLIPIHGVGCGRRIDLEFPGWLGFCLFVCFFPP